MRPVLILQHESAQGPGYLAECLQARALPFVVVRPDQREPLPSSGAGFSGLVVLGSDRSVNDPQPWIAAERALMQDAVRRGRPILGHCFGAQQLARVFGAAVTRQPRPDIGWRELWVTPAARACFGGQERVLSFNWHYDSFQMPTGASRLLFGANCLNKGFRLGPHIGLQSHLEVTAQSLRDWCAEGREELRRARGLTVQADAEILSDLPQRLARLRRGADSLYPQWIDQLGRPPLFGRRAA